MTAATAPASSAIDQLYPIRLSVKAQLKSSLVIMRLFILPQIATFGILCIIFAVMSVWGITQSIANTKPDLSDLKSLVPYMSTGSSGILGAVIIPLYKRLHEMTHQYLEQEKKFSRAIMRAENEDTRQKILNAMNVI